MAVDRLTHSEDQFQQSVARDIYSGAIGKTPVPLNLQRAASLSFVGGGGAEAAAMDATLRNLNTDLQGARPWQPDSRCGPGAHRGHQLDDHQEQPRRLDGRGQHQDPAHGRGA